MSFAVFRITFGLMVILGAISDFLIDDSYQMANFISPEFHVKYTYFEWVPAWPELWMMHTHIVIVGLMGVLITLGLFYRFAMVVFTLLFTWGFLIEAAFYLNHYYLIILFSIIMIFLPMNRMWSLDAMRHPSWGGMMPGWCLALFRAQVEIVLLYAGLVKINYDWLHAEPLGIFLRANPRHIFGALAFQDWFVMLGAYGVIALHVLGAPLLFFKRTRLWVFIVYCLFHLMNSYTFQIGVFPYFTIMATTVFFAPNWPAAFIRKWPALDAKLGVTAKAVIPPPSPARLHPLVIWGAGIWLVLQILIPLRGALYPGEANWSREGYGFAWRMMLDSHRFYGSRCMVIDTASGRQWIINPQDYLTERQFSNVSTEPKAVLQFARYIEAKWQREQGAGDVIVKCELPVSLNGRKPALLIDPQVDLTRETWGIAPETWINPMPEPFVHWRDRTW